MAMASNINTGSVVSKSVHRNRISIGSKMLKHRRLYVLLLPAIIYFVIFHYAPLYGVQIAFKDFNAGAGILGSKWVGFEHFSQFFNSYYFGNLLRNTLWISIYTILVGFPVPIVLALMFNEVANAKFKKTVQLVTYAPHFISTVVMVGILVIFLSPTTGVINQFINLLGGESIFFLGDAKLFPTVYVLSDVWQHAGWNTIIYTAALSSINVELYEAARIDGANKFQKMLHVDLPGIAPMIIIMLMLNVGSVMNVGFEKVFLMQNQLNMETSDIISTYVYKRGLVEAQYSFSSAVGLFNSVVNFVLLISVNYLSGKIGETSLW